MDGHGKEWNDKNHIQLKVEEYRRTSKDVEQFLTRLADLSLDRQPVSRFCLPFSMLLWLWPLCLLRHLRRHQSYYFQNRLGCPRLLQDILNTDSH